MVNLYITSGNKRDGKTFITAGLAATMQSLGYSTSVYKPVQTAGIDINGFSQSPDLTYVKTIDPYINTHFSYIFKTNDEPLISAEKENKAIDIELIFNEFSKLQSNYDCNIIDGDCGLLSPLAPTVQNIDLIRRLQTSLVLVTTPREDSINDILSMINIAQAKDIDIRGVILNNIREDCSKQKLTSITRIIEEYSNVNILGLMPYIGERIKPEDLISGILNGIDIESVFNVKIEKLDLN